MENILVNTTKMALAIIAMYLSEGDVAVDCTVGNGNDTLKMAELVGESGKVYAFDIQSEAIKSTQKAISKAGFTSKRVGEEGDANVVLINDSHEFIERYVSESPKAVVYNLGYLPTGDKTITTCAASSLFSIKSALEILEVGGIVAITLYSGHEAGKFEKECILDFAKSLDKGKYHAVYSNMINQPNNPPETLFITKKR